MMKLITGLIPGLFLLFFITNSSLAQDLHSSNYYFNLPYLNPAESGAFLGNARVQGSYRDQSDAFFIKGYNSQIASVDMPLAINFLKKGWTGYGLGVYNDKAGDIGLRTTGISASLAYHYPFDKKNRQVLSVGFQILNTSRSVANPNNANFSDSFSGMGSGDISLVDNFSSNATDYNFGIRYRNFLNKSTHIVLGASVLHSFQSIRRGENNIQRRINIYSSVDYRVTNRVFLKPAIYASFSQSNFNIAPQLITEYLMSENLNLGAGLGYRVLDAIQVLGTAKYMGWEVGLAYDVTVSSARLYNNSRGGFEIGVKRIFIIHKKPKIDRVSICPTI